MGLLDRFRRRAEPSSPSAGQSKSQSTVRPPEGEQGSGQQSADAADTASAIVVGVFSRSSDAEGALNNLDEAGYEPGSISVVGRDAEQIATNAGKTGPLAGVAAAELPGSLRQRGLPADETSAYGAALQAGATVVAIAAPAGSEQSALEILTSQHAEHARVLRAPGDVV